MEVIRVQNLKKMYQGKEKKCAVNDISFSVEEGELFAFLGENGAGKSTTINILCTILEKTEGEVTICGHTLGKEDDAIREKIGIVFQNSVLDPKLTVKENLYLRGSLLGVPAFLGYLEGVLETFFTMAKRWSSDSTPLSASSINSPPRSFIAFFAASTSSF